MIYKYLLLAEFIISKLMPFFLKGLKSRNIAYLKQLSFVLLSSL